MNWVCGLLSLKYRPQLRGLQFFPLVLSPPSLHLANLTSIFHSLAQVPEARDRGRAQECKASFASGRFPRKHAR